MKNAGLTFKKNYVLASSEGHLYLTILPTEKCNFRCVYCYEDFELGKMSADTVEGIKNLLNKAAPTLKNLMISWFGGEPTLNAKGMIEICSHVRKLQETYDFKYSSHATTNGYLIDEKLFREFIDVGINDYQITLDGDKDCHDTTRLQMNGKGSFDVIWSNLLAYRATELDFTIMLRLHVTRQNTESMWRLVNKMEQEFGNDSRYTYIIEEIKDLGDGVETADAVSYIAPNVDERVNDIKAIVEKKIDKRSKLVSSDNAYICYAAMPRQILIRADGRIGKCTVMLGDDRNNLGRLNRDGTYELDGEKFELWTRGFANLDEIDMGCPAKRMPQLQKEQPKYNSDIEITQVA